VSRGGSVVLAEEAESRNPAASYWDASSFRLRYARAPYLCPRLAWTRRDASRLLIWCCASASPALPPVCC